MNNDQGMTAVEADDDAVVFMSMDQKPSKQSNIWIGDTGASCHMTYSLDGMSKLRPSNTTITIGDWKSITSQQVGTWQGYVTLSNGSQQKITLNDVSYVPELSSNLFSITKALSNKATLSSNGKRIEIRKNNWKLVSNLRIETKNGYVPGVVTYMRAHNLLSHMGAQSTRTMAKHLGLTISRGTFQECLDCSISKARQKNLSTISEKVSEPGNLFSSDISSSSSPASRRRSCH